jgi:glyoxylase-like metal-dependent hydrolase (beta-lactamase superfamily II)
VIDPGDEPDRIIKALEGCKTPSGVLLSVDWILHTHGHLDHVGGTRGVKEHFSGSKIAIHRGDEPLYRALGKQAQLFGLHVRKPFDREPLPAEHYFEEGEPIRVGDLALTVIHTPGHSPGSVCLGLHEDSALGFRETLYTGDTLFQGSVGRTDLWGANSDQMFKSIHDRILSLDDDTRVCPGHGPDTEIGMERRSNPFLT